MNLPVIRKNIVTNERAIFSKIRNKRPNMYQKPTTVLPKDLKEEPSILPFDEACPFCIGNEHTTGESLLQHPAKDNTYPFYDVYGNDQSLYRWEGRVVQNKFPIVGVFGEEPLVDVDIEADEFAGIGKHEVIVESPMHNQSIVHSEGIFDGFVDVRTMYVVV